MSQPEEEKNVAEEHTFLMQDLDRIQKRAAKAKFLEAQKEFAENTYPLMQTAFEHFAERLARLEQAMDALIDETDTIIQAEEGEQLLSTIDLGAELATEVMKLQAGQVLDDTTVRRLQGQAGAFLNAAELAVETVEAHQVGGQEEEPDPEGEDEESDEDEDEDEESEDSDNDDDTPTPPAAKE
jgi:hypothetical protein